MQILPSVSVFLVVLCIICNQNSMPYVLQVLQKSSDFIHLEYINRFFSPPKFYKHICLSRRSFSFWSTCRFYTYKKIVYTSSLIWSLLRLTSLRPWSSMINFFLIFLLFYTYFYNDIIHFNGMICRILLFHFWFSIILFISSLLIPCGHWIHIGSVTFNSSE